MTVPAGTRLPRWMSWQRALALGATASGAAFLVGVVAGWLLADPMFSTADLEIEAAGAGDIARNNLVVGLGMLALGLATASLGALVLLGMNGFIIGQLVGALLESGDGVGLLTGLLPHALLEVPGFVAIIAASTIPAAAVLQRLVGAPGCVQPKREMLLALATNVAVGLALLTVAAVIEDAVSFVRLY